MRVGNCPDGARIYPIKTITALRACSVDDWYSAMETRYLRYIALGIPVEHGLARPEITLLYETAFLS